MGKNKKQDERATNRANDNQNLNNNANNNANNERKMPTGAFKQGTQGTK